MVKAYWQAWRTEQNSTIVEQQGLSGKSNRILRHNEFIAGYKSKEEI